MWAFRSPPAETRGCITTSKCGITVTSVDKASSWNLISSVMSHPHCAQWCKRRGKKEPGPILTPALLGMCRKGQWDFFVPVCFNSRLVWRGLISLTCCDLCGQGFACKSLPEDLRGGPVSQGKYREKTTTRGTCGRITMSETSSGVTSVDEDSAERDTCKTTNINTWAPQHVCEKKQQNIRNRVTSKRTRPLYGHTPCREGGIWCDVKCVQK